jgi:hypothetical protein
MADIIDPQVIKWANDRARSAANQMTNLYAVLVAYQADYAAQGIAAKIVAAGTANNIADGATADGRSIIIGTSLANLKAAIDQLVTSFNTNVAGVGSPITTIQNAIQVSGSPR